MRKIRRVGVIFAVLLVVLIIYSTNAVADTAAGQAEGKSPNIVLIVADDMGYSDLGSFGGEIRTPTFDALAMAGVRFTDFHSGLSCSPTRSMLFSGTDNHIAGIGNMDEFTAPNQRGKRGYEGYLNRDVVTFAELLRDNGYHTYYVGKWHLGKKPDQIPAARGFERDFTLLDGDGSYFDMTGMSANSPKSVFTEDGKYLQKLPDDYYATKTYTDRLISFIESNRKDGKPFFAIHTGQAPHEPYGLPGDWLRKYDRQYDMGWDALREQRLKRMKEMGIVPENAELAARLWYVPPAVVLAPAVKAIMGRKMEIYAALVENLDYHIGRLVAYLKEIGEYDNTL
ncbi:MAG: sulfatase-like hydrolase/transferase, partial [Nitrospirota bacterium]